MGSDLADGRRRCWSRDHGGAVPHRAGGIHRPRVIILPVAWAASSLIHLMLAEVLFRTGRDLQIVELMRLYVLRGRVGRWLLWTVFILLSIAFLANLAAYVSGAGEILAGLAGIDRRLAEFLIYAISAGVVFFGLKAVGVAERFGALALVGLIAAIGLGAFSLPFHIQLGLAGSANQWLALYGMVMYALWTFYSVPQVVKGLGTDHRGAVRAILVGLGINGVAHVRSLPCSLSGSQPGSQRWRSSASRSALGAWAGVTGSLFIMFRPGDQLLVGVTGSGRYPARKDRHLEQAGLAACHASVAIDPVGRCVAVPRLAAPGRRRNGHRGGADHHPHVLAGAANRPGQRPRLDTRSLGTAGHARPRPALTHLDGRRFPGLS